MHLLPSYAMLSVNSSSAAFHSVLICAFIKQAIHFISFHLSLYLSLFSVNSSSKFARTLSTEELTCPCTLAAELCSGFFPFCAQLRLWHQCMELTFEAAKHSPQLASSEASAQSGSSSQTHSLEMQCFVVLHWK